MYKLFLLICLLFSVISIDVEAQDNIQSTDIILSEEYVLLKKEDPFVGGENLKYIYPCKNLVMDGKDNSYMTSYPTVILPYLLERVKQKDFYTIDIDSVFSQLVKTKPDDLYLIKEPILYNCYQGRDIYRFNWWRAFDNTVVVTLNKDNNKVWLTVKAYDIRNMYWIFWDKPTEKNIDTCIEEKWTNYVTIDKTIELSVDDWFKFEELITNCSYWKMTPINNDIGLDGSTWTIEAHLKDKYWYVNRWSPRENNLFRKCGEFLLNLSDIEEKSY